MDGKVSVAGPEAAVTRQAALAGEAGTHLTYQKAEAAGRRRGSARLRIGSVSGAIALLRARG